MGWSDVNGVSSHGAILWGRLNANKSYGTCKNLAKIQR